MLCIAGGMCWRRPYHVRGCPLSPVPSRGFPRQRPWTTGGHEAAWCWPWGNLCQSGCMDGWTDNQERSNKSHCAQLIHCSSCSSSNAHPGPLYAGCSQGKIWCMDGSQVDRTRHRRSVLPKKSVVTMKSAVGCNANWSWTNDNVFHEKRLQDPSSRISDSMFFELCKTLN